MEASGWMGLGIALILAWSCSLVTSYADFDDEDAEYPDPSSNNVDFYDISNEDKDGTKVKNRMRRFDISAPNTGDDDLVRGILQQLLTKRKDILVSYGLVSQSPVLEVATKFNSAKYASSGKKASVVIDDNAKNNDIKESHDDDRINVNMSKKPSNVPNNSKKISIKNSKKFGKKKRQFSYEPREFIDDVKEVTDEPRQFSDQFTQFSDEVRKFSEEPIPIIDKFRQIRVESSKPVKKFSLSGDDTISYDDINETEDEKTKAEIDSNTALEASDWSQKLFGINPRKTYDVLKRFEVEPEGESIYQESTLESPEGYLRQGNVTSNTSTDKTEHITTDQTFNPTIDQNLNTTDHHNLNTSIDQNLNATTDQNSILITINETVDQNDNTTALETTTGSENATTTIETTITTTTVVTTAEPKLDINALVEILRNLTDDYDTNLTEVFNMTLQKYRIPTCATPAPPTTTTPTTTTTTPTTTTLMPTTTGYDYETNATGTIMGKCYVCGLEDPEIPRNAYCSDAFAGDFIPLVPVDYTARGHLAVFRKYCRFMDVPKYHMNYSDPRSIWGRWTGGCSVRWIDLSGVYTQRACRNRNRALMGKHFLSKRMAKLEMSLQHVENGCIISPMASLVPLSRGVSLFARFHACVCTGSWCNTVSRLQPASWTLVVVCLVNVGSGSYN